MARASASTTLLNHELADLDGSSIRTKTSLRGAEQSVTSFGRTAQRSSANLDSFSVRLGLLGSAAAAIGPSIVPVMGAAVPAIGALTTGMVGATAAAGTMLLAFQGVGDAVSAVSDYQLEPTADNLAKVKAAFDEIGPSGARFVMALKEMQPVLDDLQQASRDGIFPGFERGLDELVSKAPGIISFVEDISSRVGDLGGDLGAALANDADLQEFFAFIDREAGPAMEDFGRATGNFIAGIANMIEAISGLSGGVSGDLLDMSRSFREWAAGMEDTEGFRVFADYIRTTGPQVADFLGALGEALVALTAAVAPWGAVVLPILTAAAKAFTALAESPIGPPLFAAAAAMLAVSKASALLGPSLTRMNTGLVATRTNLSGFSRDVRAMSTEFSNLGRAQSTALSFFSGTSSAALRTRESVREVGRAAAQAGPSVAAMGLLATGAADKMGLSNTAMLTLAGSMAGPWGSAAGAAVGLTMDLAAANDDLAAAVESANAAMDSGSLQETTASLRALRATLKETTDNDVLGFDLGAFDKLGAFTNTIAPLSNITKLMSGITGETDKAGASIEELEAKKAGLEELAVALGANKNSATEMASGADRAQAAMDALGISSEDLALAQRAGGVEFDLLAGRIQAYIVSADSVAGRTEAIGDAIADLGNDALSTAESASALSAALDALLSPGQDLIAAQDQMSSVLNGLKGEIDGTNKSLEGTSEAAIKNRAAISDGVSAINELVAAQSAAGASSLEVALTMDEQRAALIRQGEAAGLSKKQVESLINQMGLTPEVIRTAFEAAGIDSVDAKTQALLHRYNALPPKVQTDIAANGIPKSEADITRLQQKYKLTPAQVRTLAALKDNASGPIAAVIAALRAADGQNATVTITTRRITEIQTISIGQQTRTDRRIEPGSNADGGFYANGARAFADGGWGMDGRYYSRTPQIIPGGANILWGEKETGWEAYISGKPSERNRNLEILSMAADRLGAQVTAFANGGTSGRRDPVAATLFQSGHRIPDASLIANMLVPQIDRLGRAFDDLSNKRLGRLGRALEKATSLQEKQTERARTRFEAVRDRRNQLGSSITDGLRGDLFADAGGSAFGKQFASGSIGAVNAQLRSERDRAKQFSKDIATLRKKGVNGAALEEIIASGDADRARMFASGSTSALRSYEAAFNARQSATAAAGRLGGQVLTPEFNALRRELNRQLAQQQAMNRQLAALRKEQKQQHDAAQKSRKDNGAGPAAKRGASGRR
ncbi:MAG TPA: hypothetical protein VF062_19660 [Candidatus Limnocylindrales bacterium]